MFYGIPARKEKFEQRFRMLPYIFFRVRRYMFMICFNVWDANFMMVLAPQYWPKQLMFIVFQLSNKF